MDDYLPSLADILNPPAKGIDTAAILAQNEDGYRSNEERMFRDWLIKCEEQGLLYDWKYEPTRYRLIPDMRITVEKQLVTKVKQEQRHLYRGITYTPDFTFRITEKGKRYFSTLHGFRKAFLTLDPRDPIIYVDVKGTAESFDDGRAFAMKRKLLYHFHKKWTIRIRMPTWFEDTFITGEWMYQPVARAKDGSRLFNKLSTRCDTYDVWEQKILKALNEKETKKNARKRKRSKNK